MALPGIATTSGLCKVRDTTDVGGFSMKFKIALGALLFVVAIGMLTMAAPSQAITVQPCVEEGV